MTKKEVCALLSISPKTLQRRLAKGIYTATRIGEGQYAELSFTYADIGLPEPVPAVPVVTPEPVVETAIQVAEPTPEPKIAPTPLGPIERQQEADERFAQDYKRGDATDSAGNRIDGTNAKWPTKGIQTLIGPMPEKRPERFVHVTTMERCGGPPMTGTDGEPVLHAGSDNHPLQRGFVRVGPPSKPRDPNQTRQELLNGIWADIRKGWSR